MVRAPRDRSSTKRGTWSPEEDHKLVAYIQKYRIWNWNHMAKFAGLSRSGKSCRLRWMNYLRPNVRRGNFSPAEEELIIEMQQQLGNRWSMIASKLPGRTDNEIKNYWNTRFKTQMKHKASEPKLGEKTLESLPQNRSDDSIIFAAKSFESSNSDGSELEATIQSSSQNLSNLSYSSSSIDTQLSEFDTSMSNEKEMNTFEWFIELGSLWDEPLKIAAEGFVQGGEFGGNT